MTKNNRTLEEKILTTLRATPWIPARLIAERIGREPKHLGPVFKRMLLSGRVKRVSPHVYGASYLWAAPEAANYDEKRT